MRKNVQNERVSMSMHACVSFSSINTITNVDIVMIVMNVGICMHVWQGCDDENRNNKSITVYSKIENHSVAHKKTKQYNRLILIATMECAVRVRLKNMCRR